MPKKDGNRFVDYSKVSKREKRRRDRERRGEWNGISPVTRIVPNKKKKEKKKKDNYYEKEWDNYDY